MPSSVEWDALVTSVGGSQVAGNKLKAASPLWNGTDNFDFSALPGGYGNSDGDFRYVGSSGYWWYEQGYAAGTNFFGIYGTGGVGRDHRDAPWSLSVRCVQD